MKEYRVRWHESVAKEVIVEAESKDEAWKIIDNGEENEMETRILDSDNRVLNSIEEIEE